MKKIFSAIVIILSVILLNVSCDYAGYNVKSGMIQLPVTNSVYLAKNYTKETLDIPIDLYKLYEKKIELLSEKFNSFSGLTDLEIEEIKNIRESLGTLRKLYWITGENDDDIEEVRKGLESLGASGKLIKKIINMAIETDKEENKNNVIANIAFADAIRDNLYFVENSLISATNFVNNKSFYKSMKIIFNSKAISSASLVSRDFFKIYFPKINFVKSYEETEYGKESSKNGNK